MHTSRTDIRTSARYLNLCCAIVPLLSHVHAKITTHMTRTHIVFRSARR